MSCWQVCFAFGRWFLAGKVQGTASVEALSAQQAEGLRHILTDLGPAFVKIGQVTAGAVRRVCDPVYGQHCLGRSN